MFCEMDILCSSFIFVLYNMHFLAQVQPKMSICTIMMDFENDIQWNKVQDQSVTQKEISQKHNITCCRIDSSWSNKLLLLLVITRFKQMELLIELWSLCISFSFIIQYTLLSLTDNVQLGCWYTITMKLSQEEAMYIGLLVNDDGFIVIRVSLVSILGGSGG